MAEKRIAKPNLAVSQIKSTASGRNGLFLEKNCIVFIFVKFHSDFMIKISIFDYFACFLFLSDYANDEN